MTDTPKIVLEEELEPGQTWDESNNASSSSSFNSSSGSFSSGSLSSFSNSSSGSSSHMHGMRMHKKHKHDDKHPLFEGQTEDVPVPDNPYEGFLPGWIKNIVRDFELNVFLMITQVNNKMLNLIVTDKTLVLNGNEVGNINELAPNRSIYFQLDTDATVKEIRIVGGTATGTVEELNNNLLTIQGEPKKKIISTP